MKRFAIMGVIFLLPMTLLAQPNDNRTVINDGTKTDIELLNEQFNLDDVRVGDVYKVVPGKGLQKAEEQPTTKPSQSSTSSVKRQKAKRKRKKNTRFKRPRSHRRHKRPYRGKRCPKF